MQKDAAQVQQKGETQVLHVQQRQPQLLRRELPAAAPLHSLAARAAFAAQRTGHLLRQHHWLPVQLQAAAAEGRSRTKSLQGRRGQAQRMHQLQSCHPEAEYDEGGKHAADAPQQQLRQLLPRRHRCF